MKTFITIATGGILGYVLSSMGYGVNTFEFWIVFILALIMMVSATL